MPTRLRPAIVVDVLTGIMSKVCVENLSSKCSVVGALGGFCGHGSLKPCRSRDHQPNYEFRERKAKQKLIQKGCQ